MVWSQESWERGWWLGWVGCGSASLSLGIGYLILLSFWASLVPIVGEDCDVLGPSVLSGRASLVWWFAYA